MPDASDALVPQKDGKDIYAILGLVLGVIDLFAWLLPICGFPLAIAGLVLGFAGLKSNRRTMAIVAIVLSGIGLIAATGNALIGALLAVSHQ